MKQLFRYIISECRNIGRGQLSSVVASYYIPVTGVKSIGNYSDMMDRETGNVVCSERNVTFSGLSLHHE